MLRPAEGMPPAGPLPGRSGRKRKRLSDLERQTLQALLETDPPSWIEDNFWIEDPRDPNTGELFAPGRMILHPVQKRILRAALTKVHGKFPYSTVLFSTIKKSGKTRLGAAVACWFAATQRAYNEVYCLANDGAQSTDRILKAIKKAIDLGTLDWRQTKTRVELPNGTFIEAIPCDPSGSAGANPGLTVWSEMWGYRHQHKERLWTEMTVPPTRFGEALRWVESYAGYTDESNVLYDLYTLGVEQGRRHPDFSKPGDPPVYINDAAKLFCYWDDGDAARRMPWQSDDYYVQEAAILTPSEFERIHRNRWITSVDKAIPVEWWDECLAEIPPLDPRTPVVMAVDAAVSHDCCAAVLISRNMDPKLVKTHTQVRRTKVWVPPRGGKIDLTATVEQTVRRWIKQYNVKEVTYDEYQLHKMMTDIRKERIVKTFSFGQTRDRSYADKQLLDMIIAHKIQHDGDPTLREHVDNAQAKTIGEKYRFVKSEASKLLKGRTTKPIDALVCVSMGNERCLYLNLA